MLLLLLQTAPDAAADFAKASRASAAMRAIHVEVDSTRITKREGTYRMTATLQRDALWRIRLDQREPRQLGLDRSDRSFLYANGSLYGIDRVNQEQFQRRAPGSPSDPKTFREAMGRLDGSVDAILNPYSVSEDLKNLAKTVEWKRTREATDVVYRATQGSSRFVFAFDATTWRLRRYYIQTPDATFDWKFVHRAAPKSFSALLTAPATYMKVASFRDRPAVCTFANTATETKVRRALISHRNFLKGTVFAADRKIHIDYPNVGEKGDDFAWAYINGTLHITKGRKSSKAVDRAAVAGELVAAGIEPDLYTRELLANRTPMRGIFGSESRAKTVGQMSVAGIAGTLVELSNSQGRITVILRDKDGLVASIETEIRDTRGNEVDRTRRAYRYAPGRLDLRTIL